MEKTYVVIGILLILSIQTMAQQHSFIYEIKLYEQYRHQSMWTEREHHIQKEHVSYLDTLTQAGKLQMAGIIDQGLENHEGFIILATEDYDEAKSILENDPSVKQGMMKADLRPVTIYFKNNSDGK